MISFENNGTWTHFPYLSTVYVRITENGLSSIVHQSLLYNIFNFPNNLLSHLNLFSLFFLSATTTISIASSSPTHKKIFQFLSPSFWPLLTTTIHETSHSDKLWSIVPPRSPILNYREPHPPQTVLKHQSQKSRMNMNSITRK